MSAPLDPSAVPAAEAAKRETFDCRRAFAEELLLLARRDPRIVAVCNDSVGSSNLGAFAEAFPDRLVNVGIAEQDMVGTAAGLANGGFVPFVCAAAPFLTGRALEQIKADCAYNAYPVVLCGMSPGIAYGELGPTHHSIEDFAWTRAVSDLTVVVPVDPSETRAAVRWAAAAERPIYMRVGRIRTPALTPPDAPFAAGRITVLRQGRDVTIAAVGTMVAKALGAAERLARDGIDARVLNVSTLAPLDTETVVAAARETRGIVTAEEAVRPGGLGEAIAATVAEHHPVPMRILAVPGFAPTGSVEFLFEHFGLTEAAMAEAARDLATAVR